MTKTMENKKLIEIKMKISAFKFSEEKDREYLFHLPIDATHYSGDDLSRTFIVGTPG